jgi:hypothetical protein
MLLGTWLLVGLFVDGWAHTNLDTLETFFTPWHALFYSGFGATVAWIAYCVQRTGGVPRGYAPAVVAVAAFTAGCVGDMIWHTVFGIEKDVEALLSPTHLVLFASMILILSSPFQAAWASPEIAPSLRRFLPALLSLTLVTALCLFFLLYLTPFNSFDTLSRRDAYIATMSDTGIAQGYRDLGVRVGLAGFYITTVVLLAPVLLVLRRWRPPFGSTTVLFSVVAMLVTALEEFQLAPLIVAAAAAGLVLDTLAAWLRPSPARVGACRLFAALAPAALWSAYFITVGQAWGTWWTINLVGGAIGMASLAGVGLAPLAPVPPSVRPPVPPRSSLARTPSWAPPSRAMCMMYRPPQCACTRAAASSSRTARGRAWRSSRTARRIELIYQDRARTAARCGPCSKGPGRRWQRRQRRGLPELRSRPRAPRPPRARAPADPARRP